MKVVAVVLDNGDENLEKCLESLSEQTLQPDIIVVGGDRTKEATEYEVVKPVRGFLNARLFGLNKAKKAGADIILSCDSDTIYHHEYCEAAAEGLRDNVLVRAGTIIPKEESPLGNAEVLLFYKLLRLPYDHILAMRKEVVDVLKEQADFTYPREDIFTYVLRAAIPYKIEDRMIAYVDVPTHHFRKIVGGDITVLIDAFNSLMH